MRKKFRLSAEKMKGGSSKMKKTSKYARFAQVALVMMLMLTLALPTAFAESTKAGEAKTTESTEAPTKKNVVVNFHTMVNGGILFIVDAKTVQFQLSDDAKILVLTHPEKTEDGGVEWKIESQIYRPVQSGVIPLTLGEKTHLIRFEFEDGDVISFEVERLISQALLDLICTKKDSVEYEEKYANIMGGITFFDYGVYECIYDGPRNWHFPPVEWEPKEDSTLVGYFLPNGPLDVALYYEETDNEGNLHTYVVWDMVEKYK